MLSFDPIKFLHEIYATYNDFDKARKLEDLIREMLLREISSNLDLLREVQSLSNRKKDRLDEQERIKLLQYLKFDFFEFSKMSGIPLSEVIKDNFNIDSMLKYKSRLKNIKSNAELVEKTYSKMRMQYIFALENISKRSDSIDYTIHLALLTKIQIIKLIKS
jgi:hypothetical protein